MYFSGTTNFYNSGSGAYGNSGQSEDFPILNAYQPCLDTTPPTLSSRIRIRVRLPTTTPYPTDAFVAKINPLGGRRCTAAFLDLPRRHWLTDSGTAIAIDSGAANIYLTGATNSSDFVLPTGSQPFQLCLDTPPTRRS